MTPKKVEFEFSTPKKVKKGNKDEKNNLIRKVLITCKFDLAPGFLIYLIYATKFANLIN